MLLLDVEVMDDDDIERVLPRSNVFFETWISGIQANEIIAKLGFVNSLRIEVMGFSGRILILWCGNVIPMRVRNRQGPSKFLCSTVYASPQPATQRKLLEYFDFFAKTFGESWVIDRDFNLILELSKWACGAASVRSRCNGFQNFLFDNGLQDLDRELELWKNIEDVLKHEELLWFQKSRTEWLTSGDRNTRYFYSRIMARQEKIRLKVLKLKMRNDISMRRSFNNMWWIFLRIFILWIIQ
ncbi:hypothetical protein CXB51_001561 [Gossypium anomalum]|uniref:Endonuclease/exonuclease/phosphatase n=1 Tax=Gossypium anomalum TaxID=47600 RepID=A0A8J5ZL74_9ROSI|nr:hypothetical protein CXB51_001561 [Gossypium anomalum]